MRVVCYEDRLDQLIGLKLLLLSMRDHMPETPVDVFVPNAPESFAVWIRRAPDATLHTSGVSGRSGYGVKPSLLRWGLHEGGDPVVWVDADVIVTKDFAPVIDRGRAPAISVTEEPFGMPHQGGTWRSRQWGLPAGRALPATTNTAVTGVHACHLELLDAWDELLGSAAYVQAQAAAWDERPIHLMGDQEVLCALLESTRFADIPINYIRRGREIAHCFQHHGYMPQQMLSNLARRSIPPFVHCHGAKPWLDIPEYRLHLDVSPYTLLAKQYRQELDEECEWLTPSSETARRLIRMFRSDPWSTSLPLSVGRELREQRLVKTGAQTVVSKLRG